MQLLESIEAAQSEAEENALRVSSLYILSPALAMYTSEGSCWLVFGVLELNEAVFTNYMSIFNHTCI